MGLKFAENRLSVYNLVVASERYVYRAVRYRLGCAKRCLAGRPGEVPT